MGAMYSAHDSDEFWSSAPRMRYGLPSTMSCLEVGVATKCGKLGSLVCGDMMGRVLAGV